VVKSLAARALRAPAETPPHLAEKILSVRAALAGERKLVTVLFADLRGSLELLVDHDPEEARALLDPVLERMMEAVHRYEGTVNKILGDGIMAIFGAPLAHEDHALRIVPWCSCRRSTRAASDVGHKSRDWCAVYRRRGIRDVRPAAGENPTDPGSAAVRA